MVILLFLVSFWIKSDELPFRAKLKYHYQMVNDYNHSRMHLFNSDIALFTGYTALSLLTQRQKYNISKSSIAFNQKDKTRLVHIKNAIQESLITHKTIINSALLGASTAFVLLGMNKENSLFGLCIWPLLGASIAASYFLYNRLFQEVALLQTEIALALMDTNLRVAIKLDNNPQALIPGNDTYNTVKYGIKRFGSKFGHLIKF